MEIPDALKAEVKALVDEIARPFNEKIRDLDQQADARWEKYLKDKDVLDGNAVKALLAERQQEAEKKATAIEKALTERMDQMEAKAKDRRAPGGGDVDAEIKAALDKTPFNAHEYGNRARFTIPTKAVTTITNANAGGANFYAPGPGIREYPQMPLMLRDLVMPGTITGSHFKFERELAGSMEGDAGYQTTEGTAKATMDIYTEIVTREVATIAVTARVSQQVFDDRPAFISFLRGRMGYRLLLKLNNEILNGTGNGSNGMLEGINTVATAYDNGHVTAGVTAVQALDVIRFARNQVELGFYVPNGTVLHPTTWATIETLKDGDERYLIGDPRSGGSTGLGRVGSIWGLPVVSTPAQTADEFTVGDFNLAQLFTREEMEVLASTEDQDNFVKNLVTLRAEGRWLLAIYSALAFVTGDFSDSIAAT